MSNEYSPELKDLLPIAIQVMGRLAISPDQIRAIIGSTSKYIKAYNLCNGSYTQKEIVKKLKIDQGNLSRAMNRWVMNGILFWIGKGVDIRPIHIYPILEKISDRERK